jgi:DNA-directed RNA polymerase subunit RPC12/RpoP
MGKPETVDRLCIKCHTKTVHEIRDKTVAGVKVVCTDCGFSQIVTKLET